MKRKLKESGQYRRDVKRAIKRGMNMKLLDEVVELLREDKTLPRKYNDHALQGNWIGFRECHIAPDWLLVYRYEQDVLILVLQRTGTHSDLF